MAYWVFKQSDTPIYPEGVGHTYVYDNMHSVRVAVGDLFVYLDKSSGGYAFIGHGVIQQLQSRQPTEVESQARSINRVYTALIGDYVEYSSPLDIRAASRQGRRNRLALGIAGVNPLGWSRSIASLNGELYERIITLAYRHNNIPITPPAPTEFSILDSWSFVKKRHGLERFKETVLSRQNHKCAICGTRVREVLEAAHISSYANDVGNRANPRNGIGLCSYCHRAFDSDIFRFSLDGSLTMTKDLLSDQIAALHMSNLSDEVRRGLLQGIGGEFLLKRYGNLPR